MDIRTQRLNEAFRASGMTQAEICRKTKINQGAMSSYLSGRYFPKQKALESLSAVLNVPIPYLMGYDLPDFSGVPFGSNASDPSNLLAKIHKLSEKDLILLEGIIDVMLKVK